MAVLQTWLVGEAVLLSPCDHVLVTGGKCWTAVGFVVKTGARGLRAVVVSCMEAVYSGLMVVQQNVDTGKLLWLMRCRRQQAGVRPVAVVSLGNGSFLV